MGVKRQDIEPEKRCRGVNRDASPCGRPRMAGSDLCHWHKTGHGLRWHGKKICNAVRSAKRHPEFRGSPCRAFAVKGYSKCQAHGGGSGGRRFAFRSPAMRNAKKRAEVEESDRLYDLWLAKQAAEQKRIDEGRLPRNVGFAPEPAPKRSLEDQFRESRGTGRKRWTPY
jgi:hypothetical protein